MFSAVVILILTGFLGWAFSKVVFFVRPTPEGGRTHPARITQLRLFWVELGPVIPSEGPFVLEAARAGAGICCVVAPTRDWHRGLAQG